MDESLRTLVEVMAKALVDKPEDVLWKALDLAEKNKLSEEGANARKFVEKNDWEKVTDEFERSLEELV